MLFRSGPWTCSGHSAAWENRAALTFQQRGGAVKALSPEARPFCDRQVVQQRADYVVPCSTQSQFPDLWSAPLSVIFETASMYCISDSFIDYDGYSISSKRFLPPVVDLMVINSTSP